MIRFTQSDLDSILADLLGKPWRRGASGPDSFDCYNLAKTFLGKVGVEIADIGKVNPEDSRPVYEQQQVDYIRLPHPRPWSLVTFSTRDLHAHIGVVLPGDNLFLHCPGRAAGKVIAEPLSRRPWRDSVDGYWWPKGYVETIVMLTPMTTTKRAWQFVRAGRSLAEIIEQDITEGRDVRVQVFLDGEPIPQDRWMEVVPTELQQIVVRPVMGDGDQGIMVVGMIALAVLAPYAAAALVPAGAPAAVAAAAAAGQTVGAGTVFAYNLAAASVMMAGGLALNALVGPDEAKREGSQHYTWNPQTTQRAGALIPLVYGTYGVRGMLLCAYATSEYIYNEAIFTKVQQIRHATELYHTKIAYSDGPIEGVIAGTERLNDRDIEYYSGSANFVVQHFRGTDDQAASAIKDAFEIPVGLECFTNEPVSTFFTAVDCDSASLVLRFPNGCTNYEKDGGHKSTVVTVKAEIREENGVWHTLMNGGIAGDSRDPMRYNLNLAGTYTGGAPFTIVAGTRYEAKITRLSNTHSDKGDSFLFDSVQFGYNTAQKLPGIAYTAIGAAASREISGSIQYYAKIKGKLVCIYDANGNVTSIEWIDNPSWVAVDLLTRPVIKGNGSTVPYTVEYYKRQNPSYLNMADFVAFAAWCDELVPDGSGGTEKRYVFNGVFDQDGSAWDQAIRVCKMACAMPYFIGHKIGVAIDKPGTPSQMFNISNLRSGFSETWIDTSEAATIYDVDFVNEQGEYIPESYPVPLAGATLDIPVSADGFGHTKRSQVWRRFTRDLRVNRYMKRTVEIPATLDAIYTKLGDIVYVQHPTLNRATGGRIVEVYADGVKLDKPVLKVPAGAVAHWRLNENAADTVVSDASGNGRHGIAPANTSTFSVPGKVGNAFSFTASNAQAIRVPHHTSLSLSGGGAVCLWFKRTATSVGFLIGKGFGWSVYVDSTGKIRSYTNAGTVHYSDGSTISLNTWTHVVAQFNTTSRKIYVNGVDVTTAEATRVNPNAVSDDLYIGDWHVNPPYDYFTGLIDDVRLYSRALTEAEILAIYNQGRGTEMLPDSDNHALLIRTHDGTTERLNLYTVASVTGANLDVVTINGVWEYTPNPNDLWTFGEEVKVVDLYRVKGFERTGGGKVLIRGTQYATEFYAEDEDAPKIQAKIYSTTRGGKSPTLLPTTAEAIKASMPDGNSTVDSLIWEGLVFAGNAADTVTWTCSSTGGAGVKYKGVWVPIFDDAIGTTDRYIYFDPNIGDPRYLQHTNNLADLLGQERYFFCVNKAGVAYFKPGLLVTSDEQKLDGIEQGADVTRNSNIASGLFLETFENPNNDFAARWQPASSGEWSIESGGQTGGKFLRCGNNADNDRVSLMYYYKLPYNAEKLYRIRIRARRTAGTGTFYCGIYGYDSAGVALNPDGSSAHWICARGDTPNATWTTYTAYFTGHSAAGTTVKSPSVSAPASLRTGVCYFVPRIFANYPDTAGITEIDEVSIDVMPSGGAVGTDAIAQGAVVNYGAAYTDEFAMLNTASGEADMQSITITTNGLPLVIHYGATVQYGNGASSAVLRLYRVGSTEPLQTSTIIKAEVGDDKGYFSAFIHTMPAGTYTYKFTSTGGANWLFVGKRFLSVTEFKR